MGNLANASYPGIGQFTYTYDAAANLTQVNSPYDGSSPLLSNIAYTPLKAPSSINFGNGFKETRTYNNRLALTGITVVNSQQVSKYFFSVTNFAPNGNYLYADSNLGAWTYSYDDFNRLSTAISGTGSFSFAYDQFGNRWRQDLTAGSGLTHYLTFNDTRNQEDSYCYDAAGTVASPRSWFRLPGWLRAQGSLIEDKYTSGWGAIQIRLTGALVLAAIAWVLYDMLLKRG